MQGAHHCQRCGEPLPVGCRRDRKFCSDRCRSAASRQGLGTAASSESDTFAPPPPPLPLREEQGQRSSGRSRKIVPDSIESQAAASNEPDPALQRIAEQVAELANARARIAERDAALTNAEVQIRELKQQLRDSRAKAQQPAVEGTSPNASAPLQEDKSETFEPSWQKVPSVQPCSGPPPPAEGSSCGIAAVSTSQPKPPSPELVSVTNRFSLAEAVVNRVMREVAAKGGWGILAALWIVRNHSDLSLLSAAVVAEIAKGTDTTPDWCLLTVALERIKEVWQKTYAIQVAITTDQWIDENWALLLRVTRATVQALRDLHSSVSQGGRMEIAIA